MEEALVPAFRMIVNYVVNGLLGPRTAPWKAKHEARAREIEAHGDAAALSIQAEAHAEALKSVSSAYQDVAASSDFYLEAEHDLEGLVVQVMQHEHTRRQQNLLSVLAQAREYVGDAHVNDHEPDPDWTSRFFSDAQDVSSEGMQALWARILAGEVERPGSTSIRTLGIMKDLDRSIAVDFRRLCTLSLTLALPDGTLIDCRAASLGGNAASNALQDYGLAFNTLNVLNEYGLIISDYNSWQPYPYRFPLQYQGKPWMLLSSDDPAKMDTFKVSGVALTKSGRELSRVVEPEVNIQEVAAYNDALAKYLTSQRLTLVPISQMTD